MGDIYKPAALDQALITVNRAADLAWDYLRAQMPVRIQKGEPFENSLPDISPEGAQKRASVGEAIQALLATVDDETLPHEYALTSKLLRYYAENWAKDAQRYWLAYDFSGVLFYGAFAQTAYTGGLIFNLLNGALAQFRFEKDGDGERYLVLMAQVAHMLRQMHERTAGQAQRGIRIHQPQLPGVRELLKRLRAAAAAGYPVAESRLAGLADAQALAAQIRRRVEDQVLPAFDALSAQLDEDYERQAPAEVGMAQLPGGREVYADLARMHTTMDMTPEQIHAAGHERMARIEAQMAQVRQQLGFTGTAAEFAVHLRKQPGAVASSPDDIGEKMRRHKGRIEARFDEYFAQRPTRDFDLVRLAPALEGSMTWGYYDPPSAEQPRGLYYYNGSRLDSMAVLGAASLVFHELVPGHHLHLNLQNENKALPPLRQHASVNAFNEGWAEYAATLTGEMGLYDDPYDRYGRLVFDAFLTTRLVVDTGMNSLGWSWEQAKAYMREHTLCAEGELVSDSLRYACGLPAQALAYKLGDEEILRLRERVRKSEGAAFDFRRFHSAILGAGAMPLPALAWHLEKVYGLGK